MPSAVCQIRTQGSGEASRAALRIEGVAVCREPINGAGLPFGPIGVAWGFAIGVATRFVPLLLFAISGTSITMQGIFRSVRKPALATLVAAGVASAFHFRIAPEVTPLMDAFSVLLVHSSIYLFVIRKRLKAES